MKATLSWPRDSLTTTECIDPILRIGKSQHLLQRLIRGGFIPNVQSGSQDLNKVCIKGDQFVAKANELQNSARRAYEAKVVDSGLKTDEVVVRKQ